MSFEEKGGKGESYAGTAGWVLGFRSEMYRDSTDRDYEACHMGASTLHASLIRSAAKARGPISDANSSILSGSR